MLAFPNAKINLGLQIISKRPDGYHNIVSCLYPIPWYDVLEIIPSKTFDFKQTGQLIPGNKDENLCVKAYQLLQTKYDLPPVSIHLHKAIPTGAGLAGGSADCAFTLRLINQVFNLGLKAAELENYAAQLGSDCPFFIQNLPAIATGRGTHLSPISLDLAGYFMVLIYPDIHVSTKEAYQGVIPQTPQYGLIENILNPVSEWKSKIENDFEKSIFQLKPQISQIKEYLYSKGAVYASMSGSGSTIFGLFKEDVSAEFKSLKHPIFFCLLK